MATVNLQNQFAPLAQSLKRFGIDIKLSHSVFALPFAASAFLVSPIPLPTLMQSLLLIICMISARSFAMGMNRYLDRDVDYENPRTKVRAIPSGALSNTEMLYWSLGFGLVFVVGASFLNAVAAWLAVPLLLVLASYSLLKRVSWICHWYLGLCLGFAPVAVSIAITGTADSTLVALGLGIACWTGGFDILYSLQDLTFDRERGLHSIPSRFGVKKSLVISRLSFLGMASFLVVTGILGSLGVFYFVGLAVIFGILVYEQVLIDDVSPAGYSKNMNAAFFNANAWVSVIFFGFTLVDFIMGVS
jgi:4-hydroxybenzoate polyprenyltransferase